MLITPGASRRGSDASNLSKAPPYAKTNSTVEHRAANFYYYSPFPRSGVDRQTCYNPGFASAWGGPPVDRRGFMEMRT
jgi:hypothetical protein